MTQPVPADSVGLYLHIPFCDAKCHYCDFVRFVDQHHRIDAYLDALIAEMHFYRGTPVSTLFIGGGTPTVLTPGPIQKLMTAVHSTFDTRFLSEATVEANPESTTPEKLTVLRQQGFNRISFGLQATSNDMLHALGRLHSVERFEEAYRDARAAGFSNINIDLMFGLPGQTVEAWLQTVDRVLGYFPDHVSAYALKIEPGTAFYTQGVDTDSDQQADMYLRLAEKMTQAGYEHYEISNFAQPGKASQHNRRYWLNAPTVGVGVSSAGYQNGTRRKNTSSLPSYFKAFQLKERPPAEETRLTDAERRREDVMLAMRLSTGVSAVELEALSLPVLPTFLEKGWALRRGEKIALTPAGWLVSNQLFQHLVG